MKRTTKQHEEWLRQRFVVARRIASGEFGGYALSESVLKSTLNVSLKTHQGDIKRAKIYATFDEWRPAKTGPKPGNRRVSMRVLRIIEEETYKRASQKLNVRKLSPDLVYDIENLGIPVREQASQSTITRIINETRAADPAHFASEQFGRLGRRRHMLQKGSLEATRPLEIVIIDHTLGDQRNFSLHWDRRDATGHARQQGRDGNVCPEA